MLTDLSEQVREWHGHADYCMRKAAEQTDAKLREDYLRLAQLWLHLARGAVPASAG